MGDVARVKVFCFFVANLGGLDWTIPLVSCGTVRRPNRDGGRRPWEGGGGGGGKCRICGSERRFRAIRALRGNSLTETISTETISTSASSLQPPAAVAVRREKRNLVPVVDVSIRECVRHSHPAIPPS